MLRRSLIASVTPALVGAFLPAQQPSRAGAPVGRQDLVVTNQNLAVVVENRTVSLPAGRFDLHWDGAPVSARTETWTVTNAREAGVRWLGLTAPLRPGSARR